MSVNKALTPGFCSILEKSTTMSSFPVCPKNASYLNNVPILTNIPQAMTGEDLQRSIESKADLYHVTGQWLYKGFVKLGRFSRDAYRPFVQVWNTVQNTLSGFIQSTRKVAYHFWLKYSLSTCSLSEIDQYLTSASHLENPSAISTLFQRAYRNQDETLIRLMHHHRIQINSEFWEFCQSQLNINPNTNSNKLSFLKRISEITTDADEHQKLDAEFDQLYKMLSDLIDHALVEARAKDQSLLLLGGEWHTAPSAAFVEMLLMEMGKSKLQLSRILSESFSSRAYGDAAMVIRTTEEYAHNLGLKKVPIDYGICMIKISPTGECHWSAILNSLPEEWGSLPFRIVHLLNPWRLLAPDSPQAMTMRDEIMVNMAVKFDAEDNLAFVGASHLWGMLSQTKLTKSYHVVPIVVSSIEMDYMLKHCPKCRNAASMTTLDYIQTPLFMLSKASGVFLTPDVLKLKAQQTHARAMHIQRAQPDTASTTRFKR